MADESLRAAIPTTFQGRTYRSRLEAEVAAWLTYLEMEFQYESASFYVPGVGHYRPDFYLPEYGWFIEARGYETPASQAQLRAFGEAVAQGQVAAGTAFLIIGPARRPVAYVADLPHPTVPRLLSFGVCGRCGLWDLMVGHIVTDFKPPMIRWEFQLRHGYEDMDITLVEFALLYEQGHLVIYPPLQSMEVPRPPLSLEVWHAIQPIIAGVAARAAYFSERSHVPQGSMIVDPRESLERLAGWAADDPVEKYLCRTRLVLEGRG